MIARFAIGLSLFAIACSSESPATSFTSDAAPDAPIVVVDSSRDVNQDTSPDPVDAGPLGVACDPSTPSSCPDGLLCFGYHTAKGWGCEGLTGCQPDLYGRCYATCVSGAGGEVACSALSGLCGCPILEGVDSGGDCPTMVCVHSTR